MNYHLIIRRPHNLLLVTGILLTISSFIIGDETVDFHMHDSYFVVTKRTFFSLSAIFLLLLWALYLIANRFLFSKRLTWLHVVVTVITVLMFLATLFSPEVSSYYMSSSSPRRYYDYSNASALYGDSQWPWITLSAVLLFVIAQLIWIFNLVGGIVTRLRRLS